MLAFGASTPAMLIAVGLDVSIKALLAAAVASAIAALMRRHSARVRYRVWLGALVATGLAVCLAPLHDTAGDLQPPAVVLSRDALPAALSIVLVWVWALGVLVHAARALAGVAALAIDRRRLPIARGRAWHRHVAHARATLGLRASVRVLYGDPDTVPRCWGLISGIIVVPVAAAAWSRRLQQAVLLHECAHLRRRDPLVMLVEQLICAALWFNPAVWLVVGRLRRERELACDETVVGAGMRADVYARLLVTLARQCRPTSAPAHAIVRARDMQERVAALLADNRLRVRPRYHGVVAAAAVLFACLTGTRVVAIAAPVKAATSVPPGFETQPGESPASFRAGLFGSGR